MLVGCMFGWELASDLAQPLCREALEQARAGDLLAVQGRGAVLDQGATCDEQFLEVVDGLADDRSRLELGQSTEPREHGCIDRVGLSTLADGFGEATRLERVDLDQRDAGRSEGALEGVVIGAGGLEDDTIDGMRL